MATYNIDSKLYVGGVDNKPISYLKDQKKLKQYSNKNDKVNDEFTYLEVVDKGLLQNKRLGQFNEMIGLEEPTENLILTPYDFFIADERVFPSHTIDKEYYDKHPLKQRLPYHDITSGGYKKNKYFHERDAPANIEKDEPEDKWSFEKKWLLTQYDDTIDEVPVTVKEYLKKGKTNI